MKAIRPLAAALLAALPAATLAETALTVYSSAQPGTLNAQVFRNGGEGMAIPGYALVREDREFTLKGGRNVLRVSDVPALIDPTTVAFASLTDPKGTRVVEQNFEFDLTSANKLLSRYLDREITVKRERVSSARAGARCRRNPWQRVGGGLVGAQMGA